MLELKAVKVLSGMSQETLCFEAKLYWKGKKIGSCGNEGHGGPTQVWFDDKKFCHNSELFTDEIKEWLDGWSPKESSSDNGVPDGWYAEHYKKSNHSTKLEIWVDEESNRIDADNQMKRRCRTKVCFKLKSQDEGQMYEMKSKWDTATRDYIINKFGDDVEVIYNQQYQGDPVAV